MNHLFLDTDILLDLLTGRMPFMLDASKLFSLLDHTKLKAFTSSLSFSNIYYVLRKYASHNKIINKLSELSDFVEILPVDETIIKKALNSRFKDFEDAIQCFAAQDHSKINVIITRNIKDFKTSTLPVMSAGTWIRTYQQTIKD